MVTVKLLVSRSGPAGAFNVGQEIKVDADEAGRMVSAGQAEMVRGAKVEKATRKANVEKADG